MSTGLVEIAKLGRTVTKSRGDILASFDHHGSSNGPTGAINAHGPNTSAAQPSGSVT
ncbi:MAG TPA: transposase [Candidatus Luteococcus avicola]|nr:transposase [Candidatus Luteococcus avicola]